MKVAVLGVGRSGTKAIYTILQEMMLVLNPSGSEFVYEPFLWDRQTFDGRFNEVKDRFSTMNSLSIEGIASHLSLPLFIREPMAFHEHPYVNGLLQQKHQGRNLLLKFIRANGRIRLLKRICPELKIVFVIRNPLDTIHSILQRFSYYGGEFHKDDYPRFLVELNEVYRDFVPCNVLSDAQREVLFWYSMNRFALETLRDEGIDAILVCLESYALNPQPYVERFSALLNCPVGSIPESMSRKSVGVVTNKFEIAKEDFESLLPYLQKYQELLTEFRFEHVIDIGSITRKYEVRADLPQRKRVFYGYTPIQLIRQLERTTKELKKVTEEKNSLPNDINH